MKVNSEENSEAIYGTRPRKILAKVRESFESPQQWPSEHALAFRIPFRLSGISRRLSHNIGDARVSYQGDERHCVRDPAANPARTTE